MAVRMSELRGAPEGSSTLRDELIALGFGGK